jgi:MinD superfamily P-loop ATPase
MVFPELCHSCGGCSIVCPRGAIVEEPRQIGRIIKGSAGAIDLVYGEINVGEPLAVPVIAAVKEHINVDGIVILDAPPGTACPVVETIHGSDFCLLVTEPTPFGLHDLSIAVEVVRQLEVPFGVVINFSGVGDQGVYNFCEEQGVPILMEIPFDRRIAELYSRGIPFVEAMPEWKKKFKDLADRVWNSMRT